MIIVCGGFSPPGNKSNLELLFVSLVTIVRQLPLLRPQFLPYSFHFIFYFVLHQLCFTNFDTACLSSSSILQFPLPLLPLQLLLLLSLPLLIMSILLPVHQVIMFNQAAKAEPHQIIVLYDSGWHLHQTARGHAFLVVMKCFSRTVFWNALYAESTNCCYIYCAWIITWPALVDWSTPLRVTSRHRVGSVSATQISTVMFMLCLVSRWSEAMKQRFA